MKDHDFLLLIYNFFLLIKTIKKILISEVLKFFKNISISNIFQKSLYVCKKLKINDELLLLVCLEKTDADHSLEHRDQT